MKKNLLIDVAILDVTNTSNTDVFNLAKQLQNIQHHIIRVPEFSGMLNANAVEKIVENQIKRFVTIRNNAEENAKKYDKKNSKKADAVLKPFGYYKFTNYNLTKYDHLTSVNSYTLNKNYTVLSWSVVNVY